MAPCEVSLLSPSDVVVVMGALFGRRRGGSDRPAQPSRVTEQDKAVLVSSVIALPLNIKLI